MHPQEVLTSEITMSDLPELVNLKGKDTDSPCMIFPKSCDSCSNLKAGNCERSPFPLAVFGFSITSEEIRWLLQDDIDKAIAVPRMMIAVKYLFINKKCLIMVAKVRKNKE